MSIRGILRPQATQRVRQSAILANAEQPMAAAIDGAQFPVPFIRQNFAIGKRNDVIGGIVKNNDPSTSKLTRDFPAVSPPRSSTNSLDGRGQKNRRTGPDSLAHQFHDDSSTPARTDDDIGIFDLER
jgi:hypothetical protein